MHSDCDQATASQRVRAVHSHLSGRPVLFFRTGFSRSQSAIFVFTICNQSKCNLLVSFCSCLICEPIECLQDVAVLIASARRRRGTHQLDISACTSRSARLHRQLSPHATMWSTQAKSVTVSAFQCTHMRLQSTQAPIPIECSYAARHTHSHGRWRMHTAVECASICSTVTINTYKRLWQRTPRGTQRTTNCMFRGEIYAVLKQGSHL